MKHLQLSVTVWIISLLISVPSYGTEIFHYKDIPITISLTVGHERTLHFGDHIQTGITQGQQLKQLFRLQSAQGALHILPLRPFDKQRVQIRRINDNRVIIIDFIASVGDGDEKPLTEDIKVLLASDNVVSKDHQRTGDDNISQQNRIITPVDLTRYAAQQLYGPTRLHRHVTGISQVASDFNGAIRLFKGENSYKTSSEILIVYKGGGYYLAVIHIKNKVDTSVDLSYLDINVPFTHATVQHHKLWPHGTAGDDTILYLALKENPKSALYPWSYYSDNYSSGNQVDF